jgi:hypothetical protein
MAPVMKYKKQKREKEEKETESYTCMSANAPTRNTLLVVSV